MSDSKRDEKLRIRALIRSSRAARIPEEIAAADVMIGHRLRSRVEETNARRVTCFMSTPREPGTRHFLAWAASAGLDVLFPSSRTDGLLDWIRPADTHALIGGSATGESMKPGVDLAVAAGFTIGAFGIAEPVGERLPPEAIDGVDLVIAPAAAADRSGVRMGWGLGYFDRTLAQLTQRPPVIAVVYDDELFDELPSEAHDVRMSAIVTPNQTLSLDDLDGFALQQF